MLLFYRVKALQLEAHSQDDAERAAGMGSYKPAKAFDTSLPEMDVETNADTAADTAAEWNDSSWGDELVTMYVFYEWMRLYLHSANELTVELYV